MIVMFARPFPPTMLAQQQTQTSIAAALLAEFILELIWLDFAVDWLRSLDSGAVARKKPVRFHETYVARYTITAIFSRVMPDDTPRLPTVPPTGCGLLLA